MSLRDRLRSMELEPRERRTVTIGGVVAVLIVLFWLGTGGASGEDAVGGASAVEGDRLVLLARYRSLAARADEIRRRAAEARRARRDLRRRLLAAPDRSLASAGLDRAVRRMAEASGMVVERIAPVAPDSLDGGLVRVAVEAGLAGDVIALGDLLRQLEDSEAALHVAALQLSVPGGPTAARSARRPPLRVRMTVAGFFAPPVGTDPTGAAAEAGSRSGGSGPAADRIRRIRQSKRTPRRTRGGGGER